MIDHYVVGASIAKVLPDAVPNLKRFSKQNGHLFEVQNGQLATRTIRWLTEIGTPSETAESAQSRLAAKLSGSKTIGTPPDRSGNDKARANAAMEKLKRANAQGAPKNWAANQIARGITGGT